MNNRRSYSGLMQQPAYYLMNKEELVASIRAQSIDEAVRLFKKAKLQGTHVTKAKT